MKAKISLEFDLVDGMDFETLKDMITSHYGCTLCAGMEIYHGNKIVATITDITNVEEDEI